MHVHWKATATSHCAMRMKDLSVYLTLISTLPEDAGINGRLGVKVELLFALNAILYRTKDFLDFSHV